MSQYCATGVPKFHDIAVAGAAFLQAGEAARFVGDRERTYSAEREQGSARS